MADVTPFAAIRYNTKDKGISLAQVYSPPYDVISPEYQQVLYDRSPYNFVQIDFGKPKPNDDDFNNQYTRAAGLLQQWRADDVLTLEKKRCYYAYEQEFTIPGTEQRCKRRGFFGLVRLMDYRSGRIRAHERTFAAPKADRLKLLRATQFNLSPIFVLYPDEDHSVKNQLEQACEQSPAEQFTDESGTIHRLWLIQKKDALQGIHDAMKNRNLFIADGHHRYETALTYRDEMREITGRKDGRQPFDYALMYLNDFADEGLVILPTHRVLAREYGDVNLEEILEDMGQYFALKEFSVDMDNLDKASAKIADKVKPAKATSTRMVMVLPSGRSWILTLEKGADLEEMIDDPDLKPEVRRLDVTLLHRYVISRGWIGNPEVELEDGDIFYEKSILGALTQLKKRKGCVAFILNSTTKQQVQEVAALGELMPQKSTYFYPKLASGLLLRDLAAGFE